MGNSNELWEQADHDYRHKQLNDLRNEIKQLIHQLDKIQEHWVICKKCGLTWEDKEFKPQLSEDIKTITHPDCPRCKLENIMDELEQRLGFMIEGRHK